MRHGLYLMVTMGENHQMWQQRSGWDESIPLCSAFWESFAQAYRYASHRMSFELWLEGQFDGTLEEVNALHVDVTERMRAYIKEHVIVYQYGWYPSQIQSLEIPENANGQAMAQWHNGIEIKTCQLINWTSSPLCYLKP